MHRGVFRQSLLMLSLALPGFAAHAAPLSCNGTAPDWRLELEPETANFSQAMKGMGEARWQLRGKGTGQPSSGYIWRGRSEGAEADLVVFITQAAKAGALMANVALPNGESLNGQCEAGIQAVPETPQPLPWWEKLADYLPAMSACLGRSQGPDKRVTKVWQREDGRIAMRTRNIYQGWWDCTVSADGEEVLTFEALPADSLELPGEGLVVFTGAENHQPPGACYQNHRPVSSETGGVQGWLSDLIC
ncbi:MAG: hypothetical protein H6981_12780 [Gammaproteobacteria bacterium]|nr:hypothetical protein [Gammaproteobacteria bacterium]MCP5137662.1 hypothetical protein [Gammaproteobacteria bacterium]